MTLICSPDCKHESDELKRNYRAALKSNNEHKVTIQNLQKDLGDLYLQHSLLKDATDGLYRQSLELSKHLRQHDPAVKTTSVAQSFSQNLLNFQVEYARLSKGNVGPSENSGTKEAEKKIESLEDEIHALKSEIVQNSIQENQQVEELKKLIEELNYEVQRKDLRIDILVNKLESSKDDNKCNELKLLTSQVNHLLEDMELLKICQENDNIKIAELEDHLKESQRVIIFKDDEIAILKHKLKQQI